LKIAHHVEKKTFEKNGLKSQKNLFLIRINEKKKNKNEEWYGFYRDVEK